MTKEQRIKRAIKLLESVTGKRVILKEDVGAQNVVTRANIKKFDPNMTGNWEVDIVSDTSSMYGDDEESEYGNPGSFSFTGSLKQLWQLMRKFEKSDLYNSEYEPWAAKFLGEQESIMKDESLEEFIKDNC